MIISRWQAQQTPSMELIKMMHENAGLDANEELSPINIKFTEHRHPFNEIRTVVSGELIFNVAGNQFLLRPGDRVEVPSNTKHSHGAQGSSPCLCIVSQKVI